MKRFALLIVTVLAAASLMSAAVVPCPTGGQVGGLTPSLADLIALNAGGGCQSQDKIFSNFSYNDPSGVVPANLVTVGLVITQGLSSDIHGWIFAPSTGSWTSSSNGFTIGFTITVASGPFYIVGSKDQINTGFVPNTSTMTDTQSMGTINTVGLAGLESSQLAYPGQLVITTSSKASISGSSLIASYEQDFFQSSIPEPVTMILIGSGLLGLGFIRRRAKKT